MGKTQNELIAQLKVSTLEGLKEVLKSSLDCLKIDFKKEFSINEKYIDLDNKRLLAKSGGYYLQWTTREEPNQPISDYNKQTRKGIVTLVKLDNIDCL